MVCGDKFSFKRDIVASSNTARENSFFNRLLEPLEDRMLLSGSSAVPEPEQGWVSVGSGTVDVTSNVGSEISDVSLEEGVAYKLKVTRSGTVGSKKWGGLDAEYVERKIDGEFQWIDTADPVGWTHDYGVSYKVSADQPRANDSLDKPSWVNRNGDHAFDEDHTYYSPSFVVGESDASLWVKFLDSKRNGNPSGKLLGYGDNEGGGLKVEVLRCGSTHDFGEEYPESSIVFHEVVDGLDSNSASPGEVFYHGRPLVVAWDVPQELVDYGGGEDSVVLTEIIVDWTVGSQDGDGGGAYQFRRTYEGVVSGPIDFSPMIDSGGYGKRQIDFRVSDILHDENGERFRPTGYIDDGSYQAARSDVYRDIHDIWVEVFDPGSAAEFLTPIETRTVKDGDGNNVVLAKYNTLSQAQEAQVGDYVLSQRDQETIGDFRVTVGYFVVCRDAFSQHATLNDVRSQYPATVDGDFSAGGIPNRLRGAYSEWKFSDSEGWIDGAYTGPGVLNLLWGDIEHSWDESWNDDIDGYVNPGDTSLS